MQTIIGVKILVLDLFVQYKCYIVGGPKKIEQNFLVTILVVWQFIPLYFPPDAFLL